MGDPDIGQPTHWTGEPTLREDYGLELAQIMSPLNSCGPRATAIAGHDAGSFRIGSCFFSSLPGDATIRRQWL